MFSILCFLEILMLHKILILVPICYVVMFSYLCVCAYVYVYICMYIFVKRLELILDWALYQVSIIIIIIIYSACTAMTGTWDATVGVVNITVMLVHSKETILEVQVWWYGTPFHSTDILNLSAFRAIWQDTGIVARFWHLLWFHSLMPTEMWHYSIRTTPGVTQHMCRWDIWMSNMFGYCYDVIR